MSGSRLFIAAGVFALCSVAVAFTEAAEVTHERPFGGPLPGTRKMSPPKGTNCKTPTVTCKLQSAQLLGTVCSCAGSDGKPVSGTAAADGN
jgi:hypothetical protein